MRHSTEWRAMVMAAPDRTRHTRAHSGFAPNVCSVWTALTVPQPQCHTKPERERRKVTTTRKGSEPGPRSPQIGQRPRAVHLATYLRADATRGRSHTRPK